MFATRLVACPPFDMAAPSDTITVLAPPLPRRRSVSVRACVGRPAPGPPAHSPHHAAHGARAPGAVRRTDKDRRPLRTHHTMQHIAPALPAPYAALTIAPMGPNGGWNRSCEPRFLQHRPTNPIYRAGAAAARRKSPGGRRGWCLPTSACCTSETGMARRRLRLLRPALWRPEGEEQDSSP